ncbi:MAG TPA: hypothetical protein ENG00_01325, partial [Candidatus Aenigmarchaeota archaeon]|nr:hypothetical protein [Candidatus Aenigmarchaeota archaeon]
MIRISAPGKIHLIGEHSVVYGEPAIISAVGLRTFAEAEKSDKILVRDRKTDFIQEWSVDDVLDFAHRVKNIWEDGKKTSDFSRVFEIIRGNNFKKIVIGTALHRLGIEGGISLVLDREIPIGSGLGSSASL